MDDATQKLVDEAWDSVWGFRRETRSRMEETSARMWFDRGAKAALEAAQRPPVSGEYTHVVNLARASEAKGLDALIDYLADLPTIEEWRPQVSPEQREIASGVLGQPQPRDYCVHCAGPCEHPDSSGEAR